MSLQDKFEEEMREVCEQYYDLLQQKDAIEDQLDELRDYIEITMRKYSKDEFDDPKMPVRVEKIVYTSERMRKGAKDKLKEMLSSKQWTEIYEEREIDSLRIVPRKD
jgi:NurA-like 5'-3' nuclease